MDMILTSVLPVFALIACGYGAGRFGVLAGDAAPPLNAFVYYFALPALLFLFTARAPITELLDLPFIAAFLLGTLLSYILALLVAQRLLGSAREASPLVALSATFPNTAYLGIPLFLALGDQQAVGAAIAATVAANTLFIGGTLAFYAVRDAHGSTKRRAIGDAVRSLIRNPLIVAPLVALPFAFFSIPIPVVADRFLDLLGATAGPAALFALGLSFIGRPFEATGHELVALSAIKLVAQPALVAFFAFVVLPVSPQMAKSAVILAAFPTGALAFVLALQRGLYVSQSSAVMIVTTLLSVITIPLLLIYL